jgi:DNA-binding SARP family transcriptional activator
VIVNLRIGVLGPLEVSLDGRPLHIPGGRQRAVLTALVLGRPGVLGVDRLAALVVPDATGADARNATQTYVARLRRSLGAAAGCLRTSPPGYVLDVPAGAVDAERFAALAAPRPGEAALDTLLRLDATLGLWRGPAYAEFPDLARAESARLAELRRDAEETRVEVLAGLGRTAEAVAAASALVAADGRCSSSRCETWWCCSRGPGGTCPRSSSPPRWTRRPGCTAPRRTGSPRRSAPSGSACRPPRPGRRGGGAAPAPPTRPPRKHCAT